MLRAKPGSQAYLLSSVLHSNGALTAASIHHPEYQRAVGRALQRLQQLGAQNGGAILNNSRTASTSKTRPSPPISAATAAACSTKAAAFSISTIRRSAATTRTASAVSASAFQPRFHQPAQQHPGPQHRGLLRDCNLWTAPTRSAAPTTSWARRVPSTATMTAKPSATSAPSSRPTSCSSPASKPAIPASGRRRCPKSGPNFVERAGGQHPLGPLDELKPRCLVGRSTPDVGRAGL
jgi:hypothetical protein